jgi:hypothetical protein
MFPFKGGIAEETIRKYVQMQGKEDSGQAKLEFQNAMSFNPQWFTESCFVNFHFWIDYCICTCYC